MDELQIIDKIFRPLAKGSDGAFNLQNDTAFLKAPKGKTLVLTVDVMSEGVHFLPGEDADVVAKRLVRINLSDLAAAGAEPLGYLLTVTGGDIGEEWLVRFAGGLKEDQKEFAIRLYGGDTTSGSKTLTLTLTAIGTVPEGKGLTRKGAKKGDLLCVSGTIGDAYLGLKGLKGGVDKMDALVRRYRLPEPRLKLGQALRGIATAVIDISDGLLGDLRHLLDASGGGADIRLADIPLSKAGKDYCVGEKKKLLELLSAGDDYELLFTIPRAKKGRLKEIAKSSKVRLHVIGEVTGKDKIELMDSHGQPVQFSHFGYRHFTRGLE